MVMLELVWTNSKNFCYEFKVNNICIHVHFLVLIRQLFSSERFVESVDLIG